MSFRQTGRIVGMNAPRFLNAAFVLTILSNILFVSIRAQAPEEARQPAIDIVSQAAALSNQWNKQSMQSATDLYRQAASEQISLKDYAAASVSLQEAGRLLLILGDNETAIKTLKEALSVAASHRLLTETAKSHCLLSLAYKKIGDMNASKKHLDAARLAGKKTDDKFAVALINYTAAEYYYLKQEYDQSLNLYFQAISLWKEIGAKGQVAEACIYTAYTLFGMGDFESALNYAAEAEKTFSETDNQRGIALSQIASGHILSSLNRKQTALEYYTKAARFFPDDLDLLEKGALFNGFGAIYEYYGDYELSLNYRLKALEVFRQDKYPDGQLATMHSIIGLSFRVNKTEQAESFIKEAERLAKILGDSYYITLVHRVIGDSYFSRNEYDKAIEYYLRSLTNTKGIGAVTNSILINNKLGIIYRQKNQPELAQKYFDLSLLKSMQVKNHFAQADTFYHLARLNEMLNDDEKALDYARQSVKLTETLYADVLNSKLKTLYFSNVYDRYELLIKLLMKARRQAPDKDYGLQALQAAERSRARLMLENLSLTESNSMSGVDPETVRREKEIRFLLNNKADKLIDLLSQKADAGETQKISDEIGELNDELENIKAKLKEQNPVYSAIRNPEPFNVAEFQQTTLDENSLLLEFSFGAEESYLWLIGKNEVSAYVLPPREDIESNIENLRLLLNEHEPKPDESIDDYQQRIADAQTKYAQTARELSRKLFGQIAAKLERKRLIIVPDGELRYFPVSALPQPDSVTDEPLLLTNEVVYEPSAQTLSVLIKGRRQSTPPAKNLLVFSDPVFSSDDPRFAPGSSGFAGTETAKTENFRFVESFDKLSRLTASKDESETIIETLGASGADNYSGFRATRENLLNLQTSDYKILHFATHGYVNEERPELSGIVLSRFDENGRQLNEFFRIQDIYALKLNSDLVVLSACVTGIGKEIKGEGLMSLNNAFLQTGARSVMASLWKVEDGATLELMKNFYGGLAVERLTPSESLRRAQMKLRENPRYKSPFYWAAFTVQGDFRSAPDLSGGSRFWLYLLPLLPLPLLGFYIYRRFKRKN